MTERHGLPNRNLSGVLLFYASYDSVIILSQATEWHVRMTNFV